MRRMIRNLLLLYPRGGFKVTDVPQSEGDALIWLYKQTGGPAWTDHTNWLVTHTVGNWFGITVVGGHVTVIDLNTNNLNGNIGAFPIPNLPSLGTLYLSGNALLSGDMGSWWVSNLVYMTAHATGLSGDLSGWRPGSIVNLYMNGLAVSGDTSGWVLPWWTAILQFSDTNLSGTPDISGNTNMSNYAFHDCALTQANVDAILLSVYTERMTFVVAAPVLNVGGTNAAPSGIYADEDPPVTGKGMAFELVTDPEAEGFNKWAITFTA